MQQQIKAAGAPAFWESEVPHHFPCPTLSLACLELVFISLNPPPIVSLNCLIYNNIIFCPVDKGRREGEDTPLGFLLWQSSKTSHTGRKSVVSTAEEVHFPLHFSGGRGLGGSGLWLILQEAALQAGGTELSADCETAPGAALWPVTVTLTSLCHV